MRLTPLRIRRPVTAVAVVAALAAAPTAVARGASPAAAKPARAGAQQGERQGPQPSSRVSKRGARRGLRAVASHITMNHHAYCRQGDPFMRIEAYTPSGVPVLNTTAVIDRQRVWWRTHVYESATYGYASSYRHRESGPWFYTDLNESTKPRSDSYWIHAQSGANNFWVSRHWTVANFGHKILIELQWDQNGVAVHRDAQFLNSMNGDYRWDGRGPTQPFCYMFNLELGSDRTVSFWDE
jgi:hypothetical protein